jgi:peptidoglycan/xylan/chitin deacetylase (PgdA/CDA1 family)
MIRNFLTDWRINLWIIAPLLLICFAYVSDFLFTAKILLFMWINFITFITLWPSCPLAVPLINNLHQCQEWDQPYLLTFDDGPHPDITPSLLDTLDELNQKAIFFLIGQKAEQHPNLVLEILKRGHQIGNHTYTHPSAWFWCLLPHQYINEISKTQIILEKITGQRPSWFRPPVGHHNLFLSPILKYYQLKMMIWSYRIYDGIITSPDLLLKQITPPKKGDIILLHDSYPEITQVVKIICTTKV